MKHTFNNDIDCLIMLNSGKLNCLSCILNFQFIQQLDKKTIPALILKPGSEGYIYESKMKGNPSFQTIGVISQYADVELVGCSISEHREGGIMVFSDK